jgi:hypothetical protein
MGLFFVINFIWHSDCRLTWSFGFLVYKEICNFSIQLKVWIKNSGNRQQAF